MQKAPSSSSIRERSISTFELTRFALLRLLGLVYFVTFLSFVEQAPGLLGSRGLTPLSLYLEQVRGGFESGWDAFAQLPTVFWLSHGDVAMAVVGWMGLLLSLAVVLGLANGIMLVALWALQLSIVNVGQLWYGFGWEIQLLETGLLAAFLVPLVDPRPFRKRQVPFVTLLLFRWLIVRIMLGAGLIKLRGDPCWEDLTCLYYHFETQPIPNAVAPWLHAMPDWVLQAGALYNHLCELVVPVFVFGPRRVRHVAGLLLLLFQLMLIASGNLSFLNWLTIVPIVACFDDSLLARLLPRAWRARFASHIEALGPAAPSQRLAVGALAIIVAILSLQPIANLLDSRQRMNASFDRLNIVNTYGAFGSVGKGRFEIVLEGSYAERPERDDDWFEIEFRCKPGAIDRRPCQISPYHYRLDWLIWFAAMGSAQQSPWAIHLAYQILQGRAEVLELLADGPVRKRPPRWVRARYYSYELRAPLSGPYWRRTLRGQWLEPLSLDDERLIRFIDDHGWRR